MGLRIPVYWTLFLQSDPDPETGSAVRISASERRVSRFIGYPWRKLDLTPIINTYRHALVVRTGEAREALNLSL